MKRLFDAPICDAALAGCATLVAPPLPAAAGAEVAACARWFEQLDAAIDLAGVRDAEADRIAGFAGLRVDRLGAALHEQAHSGAAAFDTWLARLQRLEAEGRAVEVANLPRSAFPIDGAADAPAARARSLACSHAWRSPLQADAALRASLLARAEVPDRYAAWQRAVGLYAVVRWPFHARVQTWERGHMAQVPRDVLGGQQSTQAARLGHENAKEGIAEHPLGLLAAGSTAIVAAIPKILFVAGLGERELFGEALLLC